MKKKLLNGLSLSLFFVTIVGCGGGSNNGSDSPTTPPNNPSRKTYSVTVIDDAIVDAKVEAAGCKNSKSLGQGKYSMECTIPPKCIVAKGGYVDTNGNGKHDNDEVSMGLPLLVNLDKNLFAESNLSNISVTPLSTLVANIKNKSTLTALASKLKIDVNDFNKDISSTHKELFQRLNALFIVAEGAGLTNQLLLVKKLRKYIVKSEATSIKDILLDALNSLKDDEELKAAYGDLFISGFIDESKSSMNDDNILSALSSEYGDNDSDQVFITGFIYDNIISNATISILLGDEVVGTARSNDNGRWKISIAKAILDTDNILLFKGTAIDSNGDHVLLQSTIATKTLKEMAKRRISLADSIDLVISNVTTAQVAILEKNDKDFLDKPTELEKNKNKIELFQQEVLLKSAAAINIMLPLIHTTKQDNLISPHYDTFGNFLSPSELELLTT
jgi:hypothetical protein